MGPDRAGLALQGLPLERHGGADQAGSSAPPLPALRLGTIGRHRQLYAKKKGITFRRFCGRLRNLGYTVKHKTFDAADYGAATHRRRLFLVARCDGKPIEWPEPTHGNPNSIDQGDLFGCDRLPWKPASDHIDFNLPCPSIFMGKEEGKEIGVKRPLAEKTMRRIALGVWRFVINNPKPFIVGVGGRSGQSPATSVDSPVGTVTTKNDRALASQSLIRLGQHGGNGAYVNGVHEPLTTVTTKAEHMTASSTLIRVGHGDGKGDSPRDIERPLSTIASQDMGLASATLIQTGYGERETQTPRALDIEKPLGTIVGTGKHAAVSAFLSKYHGAKTANDGRCNSAEEPIRTIDTEPRHAVVATSLLGCGGAQYAGKPREVDRPLGTVMTGNRIALQGANLVIFRHDKDGRPVDEPLPTITAGGGPGRGAGAGHALGLAATNIVRFNHGDKQWDAVDRPLATVTSQGNKFGLVFAFLMKYHGTAIGAAMGKPLPTVSTRDRFAVVKVEVDPGVLEDAIAVNVPAVGWCVIADIGLRMLRPAELAGCQGFPSDYQLPGSKKTQVRLIGNSVPPPLVEAIVRANMGRPKHVSA